MTELSQAKQALLELRLRQRQGPQPSHRPRRPERRSGDGPFPLSLAQQRMWLLDQLNPRLKAYNVGRVVRLRGPLDVRALERALNGIVERHAGLRTMLRLEGGEPVQRICAPFTIDLDPVEVSAAADVTAAARSVVLGELQEPFDLARGALIRARLVRLAAEDHVLTIVTHHIASDEGSKAVLFSELATRYAAARNGEPTAQAEPPLRYADYAAWERDPVDDAAVTVSLNWWRERLAGASAELNLAYDYPRPSTFGFVGARHQETLSPTALERIRAVARSQGSTPFAAVLAAYAVLLQRYSGADDVVVAVPTSGRLEPEQEGMMGMFGNTVVLRIALAGDPTFRELVSRVRETFTDVLAHEVPFERLVQELSSGASSHFPLAETTFNFFEDPSMETPVLDGLEVTPFEVDPGVAKINLALTVSVRADGLRILWEYSSEHFAAPTIVRMTSHLGRLLEAGVTEPSLRLSDLPMLAPAELAQLDDLNETATDVPRQAVHELIAAQVERRPEATAVICAGRALTYRELDTRANQLAHELISAGAGPGVVVGLRLDRSVDLVVGIQGVLRAGAAYLPVDADHPRERVERMLSDARARLLVTRSDMRDGFDAGDATVVYVDDSRLDERPVRLPQQRAGLRDLAYVMFTSGSTGRPKGVMIEHRSLVNILAAMAEHPGLSHGETMLGLTTPAFDLSVPDLFLPLMCGGTIALTTAEDAGDPRRLAQCLSDTGATVMQASPTTWQMLRESGWTPERPMRVVVGAEAMPVSLAHWLAEVMDEAWNFFGPTETCVSSMRWKIGRVDGKVVPLGRPLANTACYVVDDHGNRTPTGVPGELWIGGHGVARGYVAASEADSVRFGPDPFVPGGRIYRTGDRVRLTPAGLFEFVGRRDQQVKLRGYRIELGEIEATLTSHPNVREAAVLLREDTPGDRRLVAYVAMRQPVERQELLDHLRRTLPAYMSPTTIVELVGMPRRANGKLDRSALPLPNAVTGSGDREPPVGEMEASIAAIWSEVLEVDGLGREDDFFALGGHSLAAVRVLARLNAQLGLQAPVRMVFDAPTIASMARKAEALAAEEPGTGSLPLVRSPGPRDRFPASSQQQRMWFLDRVEVTGSLYAAPVCLAIEGSLDRAALRGALDRLVERHAVLRTTLPAPDGIPVQVVHSPVPFVLEEADARNEAGVRELVLEAARRRFDLAEGPLARGLLARVGGRRHILALVFHHAVIDAWSTRLLMDELSALMHGRDLGSPGSIEYGDYALWQLEHLDTEGASEHLRWWRTQLAGAPSQIELPADRPRLPARAHTGHRHVRLLSPRLLQRLDGLAASSGATRFMILATAVQMLLARYSGETDIVVGTPVSGRTRPELDDVVGLFMNTLVLRTRLDGKPSFDEALERVKLVTLDALAHQDVPFERVVEDLVSDRDLSRNPLFQVLVMVQDDRLPVPDFPGAEVDLVDIDPGVSRLDWSLSFSRRGDALRLSWEYSTELFDRSTIERCADHLVHLLEAIADSPDRSLSQLAIMSGTEITSLTGDLAATAAPIPAGAITDHVAAHAASRPDAIAVRCGGASTTYRQLDARANAIAQRLIEAGVPSGSVVAVRSSRSPDLVAALLGVMKAGCAYLPLDPSIPDLRTQYMLTDSDARAILAEGLAATDATTVPQIGLEGIGGASPPPTRSPSGSDVAFMIYTSGSTGRPKAVIITHENLVNLISSVCDEVGFEADDTMVAVSTISFDVATFEVLGPLYAGGCTVLSEDGVAVDPSALAKLIATSEATVMNATPSVWRMLVDDGWAGARRLRAMSGGEVLPRSLASALLARVGELWNLYGPAETTLWSTCWPVLELDDGEPPIGRPIANTACYVLDAHGALVPPGVTGELCIGGAGVGRGYHGRPDLTAEQFVCDPFVPGDRMYRTGDLVRRRPDGVLLFVGRNDRQVKLHGVRIELGEVEAILEHHPSVRKAAVLLREDEVGDPRLVAYVAGKATSVELRAHAAASLPATMIPSHFVPLASMPLTANGKLDRAALPRPVVTSEGAEREPPVGPVEERIAAVWRSVLRIDAAGRTDDFFALGGHSLACAQVIARLNAQLGAGLPVRALFDTPTIAGLAREVEAAGKAGAMPQPALTRKTGDRDAFPASSQQRRMWFLDQLEAGRALYSVPICLGIDGPLDVEALHDGLDRLARRHEVLRTSLPARDGMPVQVVHPPERFPLAEASAPDEEAARDLVRDSLRVPFDLAAGPLACALVVEVSDRRHLLALVFHHALVDAWSLRLLVDELSLAIAGETLGPPSEIQYGDFAAWQHDHEATLSDELEWWRARLENAPVEIELPADRPRPLTFEHAGRSQVIMLPGDLLERIDALGAACRATRFMVLATAVQVLLARYSGETDVVVGTPVSGRGRPELDDVVGLFANTLVLRTRLDGDPTFEEAIGRVKQVTLDALAHRDVPFERVVEELVSDRDLSRNPLFQVLVTVQDDRSVLLDVPGAHVQSIDIDVGTSRFDWSLSFSHRDGGLRVAWEYSTELFDDATIERCAEHLARVLDAAAATPSRRLSSLPLMTARELTTLDGLRGEAAEVPSVPVQELIAEQARAHPSAVAVTCAGVSLTYEELDRRANQLAHELIASGAGPGTTVGVRLDRSVDLIVAIQGVLRTGAAYVPLDPDHPRERAARMFELARAQQLVTKSDLLDSVIGESGLVVCVDDESLSRRSPYPPARRAGLTDLAYVIFTSGSTGEPKGVMIEHGSLVNLLAGMSQHPGLRVGESMLGVTTPAFDLSVPDLYLPLVNGGTLVLASAEDASDPRRLADLLDESGVTVMQATPSTWRMLRDHGWQPVRPMRAVVGGEAVPKQLAEWLADVMAQAWNFYGPTETCVWSTMWPIRRPLGDTVPIGRPLANTRCYVVDERGGRSPVGVPGELWIGGAGVARGYIAGAEEDSSRFGPEPFEASGRVYYTGDRVRLSSSGQLEFVGRRDQQVKLRGHRIELGEIEATLERHRSVREAAAIVREDRLGEQQLVAYVAVDEAGRVATLFEHLRRSLPGYMIPSALVTCERLPRLSNGKLARSALPRPDDARHAHAVRARTPLERQLVALWEDALGRDEVGIHDDLFHLGAHSLLITRVMARIRDTLGIDVPLRRFYEAPTVAELAEEIVSALLIDQEEGELDAVLAELEQAP